MNACRVPDHNLDYDENAYGPTVSKRPMRSLFRKKEMFDSLEFLDRWQTNEWGPGYVICSKDLENAAHHLIGMFEKFKHNDVILNHLDEIFSCLDIPLPEY